MVILTFHSDGNQRELKYIRILDALYDMITSPHVYYLDELGEDLHNDLLYYYLNVFIFNSDKSQLVITSQETTLLSQDMINENRGVVWFVEKNKGDSVIRICPWRFIWLAQEPVAIQFISYWSIGCQARTG